jgi:hypothetical protein
MEATAKIVQAMTLAIMVAAPGVAAALADARLAALVPDAAQLARLKALAGEDTAGLEALLRKAEDPTVAEQVLTKTKSTAQAINVLDSRAVFRQRFAERYSKDIATVRTLKAQVPELAAIPDEELAAIRGYTAEDYDQINRVLRSESAEDELSRLQPYIDTIKSGLENFPEFNGVVTRIESNTHAMYQQGAEVTKEAFTSTCGPGGKVTSQIVGNTRLTIESVTGRDIRAIAAHPKEAEVLFPPGTRFQVVSKKQPLPGVEYYEVRLRQIP